MSDYDQLIRTRDQILKYSSNLVGGYEWNVSWDSINREVRMYCFQGDGSVCFSCGERDVAVCRVADALYMALEVMGIHGSLRRVGVMAVCYYKVKSKFPVTEGDRALGIKELGL
jgi:hypothetical protein